MGKRKEVYSPERTKRRELLTLLFIHRNVRGRFSDNLMGMKDLVNQYKPVSKQLVDMLKREKGLTYTEAYVALELAYIQLKEESNFVQIQEVD